MMKVVVKHIDIQIPI